MFKLISHFSLRRYMMLCMLYTTVKLGQVVNPLLFRAVNLIPFPDVEQVVDGKTLMVPLALETGDVWDTVLVWTIVAGVATAATFATIGYNKSCNWVFRNLEKKTA